KNLKTPIGVFFISCSRFQLFSIKFLSILLHHPQPQDWRTGNDGQYKESISNSFLSKQAGRARTRPAGLLYIA
ncbi:MAG: hypothetical protein K2L77_01695, partial [Muribaculaceae bacterium]|nr:hypothetical protein [Muribaculaceae bacterium]